MVVATAYAAAAAVVEKRIVVVVMAVMEELTIELTVGCDRSSWDCGRAGCNGSDSGGG